MGKVPKVKRKGVSVHSRAARRAGSPSLDVDKSLTTLKAPVESNDYHSKILGAQNAGISKKTKSKPMSRQQRLRQQKGMERADVNLDKLEKKVESSAVKAKRIKDRASAWEELNERAAVPTRGATTKPAKPKLAPENASSATTTFAVQDGAVSQIPTGIAELPSPATNSKQVIDDVDEVL